MSDMIGHNPALESVQRMSDMIGHNPALESVQRMSDMIGQNQALESVQRMNDMVWQNPALESVQRMSNMIGHYPTLESVQKISDMIGQNPALESVQRIGDMTGNYPALESVQKVSDMIWQNPTLESAQRIRGIMEIGQALESAQRLGDIWTNRINASDLQLATISQYPLKEIALSQISNSDAANLGKSFMDYFSLSSDFQFQDKFKLNRPELPAFTLEYAARELFVATNLVKSIFVQDEVRGDNENEILKEKISIETDDKLQQLLLVLSPELPNMWLGAKEALNSSNPDKIRHFNISLRELFTQVLHKLAPDEEIKSWSNATEDFHNGQPKRETRLRYIFRGISDECLNNLIKKNISFTLESLDFLNKCTHKPKTNLNDTQLKGIMITIELLISQLIEISHLKDLV
jgi:hypothetical protein